MDVITSKPLNVMIIRHGEKPGNPEDDKNGGPDLSVKGSARATALPILFLPIAKNLACSLKNGDSGSFIANYSPSQVAGPLPRFPVPDFIFSTADSSESKRPRQTVTPTATALGITINHSFSNKCSDIKALGQELKKEIYSNKTVLICWHHGTIDNVAEAVGATGAQKWDGTLFDLLWFIDFSQSSSIQKFGQMLLFGDNATEQ
jgi:hypothetical protein